MAKEICPMKCPACGAHDSRVLDSRPQEDFSSIKRRRECIACGRRFTTYELVETLPLMVLKKDGSTQPYDRHKLVTGITKACGNRPLDVENLVTDIEYEIANSLENQITSVRLGEMVMERLREMDEIAYVRFVSVYRDFSDLDSFLTELKTLVKGKKKSR